MFRPIAILVLLAAWAAPVAAEQYQPITDERDFRQLVQGRTLVLTRPGIVGPIALEVKPSGDREGEARGYDLTGFWRWEDNRFCREMDWGGYNVSYSCQTVSLNGNELRFVADRGMFRTAYFRLN